MNNAYEYIKKQMESDEFKQSLIIEKMKLDIEMLADELKDEIIADKPKTLLIKGVNKIKRAVAHK